MAERWLLLFCLATVIAHSSDAAGATRGLIKRRRFTGGGKRTGSSSGPKPKPIQVETIDRLKVAPSDHHPQPGQLNLDLIDSRLTPPNYCYYTINGNITQPAVSKPKGGPSLELSKQIATLLAEPRPCMYYLRECNTNLTENVDMKGNCCYGDRYLKKFKTDKDPRFLARLPELPPGSLGTCAIIGNADNILQHKWGPEIDQHDFVVRFNVKMKGYEKHVGTKTGGLWTKPHYVDRKEDGDQKPTRFHINPKFAPEDLADIDGKPVLVYGPHLNRKWRPVAKTVYAKYLREKKKKPTETKPTGGWARMMAMVEMAGTGACTRLDIYGFSSGGGKYFARNYQVDGDHSINLEHFCHRLISHTAVKGKV
eukprot:CAMPEP_0117665614 /NCGR_PEP_ID=MMETSP0804-20121206/9912_1 /TAXON_ID=1074897 /ORGANISM="Tetraselmis astigmatica, Strain CCMP880" /LENGTH=366 /DNA_ID=CAMNT_0005473055 /DNA_START=442 /DNA_END=1538 /DNA_ORIENTATION=+